MPWIMVRLISPFVPLMAEMREMEYLWRNPVRLQNDRLLADLGTEPRMSLDNAMRETLAAMGCL